MPRIARHVMVASGLSSALARLERRLRRFGRAPQLRRRMLAFLMQLTLLTCLVAWTSCVVWAAFAGEQIAMTEDQTTSGTPTRDMVRDVRKVSPPPGLQRHLVSSWSAPASGTSSPAASTLSGTKVAIGVIAFLIGSALGLQRWLLRRYRERLLGEVGAEPAVEAPVTAASLTDAALAIVESTEAESPVVVDDEAVDGEVVSTEAEEGADHHEGPELIDAGDPEQGASTARLGESSPITGRPMQRHSGSAADGQRGEATDSTVVLFDRRDSHRVPYEVAAWVRWSDGDVMVTTANLSPVGLKCGQAMGAVAVPLSGALVEVTLPMGGSLVTLNARVAWSRLEDGESSMGLKFTRLTGAQDRLVRSVLSAEQPE